MKIEFFEPPMCCPTGVCGPSVDEKLVKVLDMIDNLKAKYSGIEIERYMIHQYLNKFKENEEVYGLVKSKGKKVLPITVVNGEVFKSEEYPTEEEIVEKLGDE